MEGCQQGLYKLGTLEERGERERERVVGGRETKERDWAKVGWMCGRIWGCGQGKKMAWRRWNQGIDGALTAHSVTGNE